MRSQFAAFVRKESLHILRDKRTMLIVFMIPVVLTVLFGFAISTEVNNVNVSVAAPEITDGVRDAVRDLEANPYFTFVGYVRQDGIDDVLRSGKADAAIVFSRDYDRRQMLNYQGVDTGPGIQVILDAPMSTRPRPPLPILAESSPEMPVSRTFSRQGFCSTRR